MANAAYWFKHDSNAKDDYKSMLLIDQLGLEGYGIFWVLIETLREQDGYRYPMAMLPILAKRYGTSGEKMKAVVTSYDLFQVFEDNTFSSPALIHRMDEYDEVIDAKKKAGSIGGKKRAENAKTKRMLEQNLSNEQALVKQNSSTAQATQERCQSTAQASSSELSLEELSLEEFRVDESSREEEIAQPISDPHAPRQDDFVDNSQENVDNSPGFDPPPLFTPPTIVQVTTFFVNRKQPKEMAERFFWNYEKKGWVSSRDTPILNWHAAAQSWIAEEKERQNRCHNGSSKKAPGSLAYDPRYRLYTTTEVDKAQLWKDVSIVRIEGASACRSANGKVLLAMNTDIEEYGLTRRDPKQVGQDWPD